MTVTHHSISIDIGLFSSSFLFSTDQSCVLQSNPPSLLPSLPSLIIIMSHIEEITDQFDETHLSASSSSSPSRTSTSTSYSSSASLGSFYDSGTLEKNPSSTSSSSYTGPKIEEITDEDEAAEAAAVSTEHLTTSDGSNLLESTSSTSSDGSVQSLSGADGVSTPTVVPSIEEILNPNSAAQTVAKDKEKALEAKNKGNQFFSRQK